MTLLIRFANYLMESFMFLLFHYNILYRNNKFNVLYYIINNKKQKMSSFDVFYVCYLSRKIKMKINNLTDSSFPNFIMSYLMKIYFLAFIILRLSFYKSNYIFALPMEMLLNKKQHG